MTIAPRTGLLLALLALLATTPTAAHEQGDRAMGVVASLSADRIVIAAADGHSVAFTVTGETLFFRGEAAVPPGEVRLGERAVVHGRRQGETLRAVRVKVGAAPSPR